MTGRTHDEITVADGLKFVTGGASICELTSLTDMVQALVWLELIIGYQVAGPDRGGMALTTHQAPACRCAPQPGEACRNRGRRIRRPWHRDFPKGDSAT